MEENEESVFELLTSLCGQYSKEQKVVRRLRSKCYEAFLGQSQVEDPRKFRDLKDSSEPTTCILSWCFRLSHEFDQKEASQKLIHCLDDFKTSYVGDKKSMDSILRFLYILRDIPPDNEDKLDLSVLPKIDQMESFQKMFELPVSMLAESEQHTNPFCLQPSKRKISSKIRLKDSEITLQNILKSQSSFGPSDCEILAHKNIPRSQSACGISEGLSQMRISEMFGNFELNKDEGYGSPTKDRILEIASERSYSDRKSWENYGYLEPRKEKPFLSELGEISSLWVENLESLYFRDNISSLCTINTRIKSRKEFLKDLKFLLIGMPSHTFPINEQHVFYLMPGVMLESLAMDTLDKFCQNFLFCGACYRGLLLMSTPDARTRKYKHPGYVYAEFCDSLSRYLQFYRTAVLSIPDSTNFLDFDEKTYQLRRQITTLAFICKVGPYISETEEMPHGVALLNYLYQQVLSLSDTNLYMVLYSILYPCCQIYFSTFLYQWVFKGSINDQYGEFFVAANLKYISTRGRTYWTRSYEIREDIVPDFLVDLKDDILFCGKMMNLLELCVPNNKLCTYLRGKIPVMLTCCLTSDQLFDLEINASRYFLEASAECGSKFDLSETLSREKFQDASVMSLMAKKRAVTLRRIELERQKALREQNEKKIEEMQMLREQYESALEQKELKIYREISKEIKNIEDALEIERLRDKLVAEEAQKMIDFYSNLCETADNRKKKVEQYLETVKNLNISTNIGIEHTSGTKENILEIKHTSDTKENIPEEKIFSSAESFHSVPDNFEETTELEILPEQQLRISNEVTLPDINYEEEIISEQDLKAVHSSKSLDLINANSDTEKLDNKIETAKTQNNLNLQQAMDNFETARRNKLKVLNEDYHILVRDSQKADTSKNDHQIKPIANLTAAQRNKLKVLSSEFGIDVINKNFKVDNILTVAQINKNRVLATNACFTGNYAEKKMDNDAFMKKSKSLMLDLKTTSKNFEKIVPMSVDSTPMSELFTPLSEIPPSVTPSTTFLSVETRMDSLPSTSNTQLTESNVFNFGQETQKIDAPRHIPVFSKRVTVSEASGITKNCLKLFLNESVSIPLLTQRKLVNNELLRYFVEELNYLKHLTSLRDYFFLQDGEFGRNITENLFGKLYDATFPLELINFRTLQHLVFNAIDSSSKYQENSQFLSFKINSLPKCFDLGNPDVLDCLSLTYKVKWPLNILLPSDAMAKYDQIFKYLVKLNRVSWVLKKIFLELKVLAKETGKKEIYLMTSSQYKRLHQCRHVMHHFIQTLQNYVVGEVLQPTWKTFEMSMAEAATLDDLYQAHTVYIKDILFRCHLNQKTTALRNIIQKIFTVVLKFYDYLRSRSWRCQDGQYVHPNFSKLDKIFKNFEEIVVYLFKVIRKVAKRGYQPHLMQFLDVLDVNGFYSRQIPDKNVVDTESHH